jgi:hypothetical protein
MNARQCPAIEAATNLADVNRFAATSLNDPMAL